MTTDLTTKHSLFNTKTPVFAGVNIERGMIAALSQQCFRKGTNYFSIVGNF